MKALLITAFQNWKTTLAGLTMIIGSTVHLVFAVRGHAADETTWTTSLLSIAGGIGLIFAGDAASSVSRREAETNFVSKTEPTKEP